MTHTRNPLITAANATKHDRLGGGVRYVIDSRKLGLPPLHLETDLGNKLPFALYGFLPEGWDYRQMLGDIRLTVNTAPEPKEAAS